MVVGLILVPWDSETGPGTRSVAMQGVGVGSRGYLGHPPIKSFGPVCLAATPDLAIEAIWPFRPAAWAPRQQWRDTPT